MTNVEILAQLKNLPAAERLEIVESTLHQIRVDLQRSSVKDLETTQARLAKAAQALLADYASDKDLTAFASLDGEAFHA